MTSRHLNPESPEVFISFPFRLDASGRSATATREEHVRDLIEQVLFTSPGERVNRLSFGSGIGRAVFQPNSSVLASAAKMAAEASIQQHLGHLIDLVSLELDANEGTLQVEVSYILKSAGETRKILLKKNL